MNYKQAQMSMTECADYSTPLQTKRTPAHGNHKLLPIRASLLILTERPAPNWHVH